MKNTPVFSTVIILLFSLTGLAQVAINTTGAIADQSAVLDISAPDKGILIPRVALSGANNSTTPVLNPSIGLLVYNVVGNTLNPGFYVWNGSLWSAIATMDQVQSVVHGAESAGIFGELYEYNAIGSYSSLNIPSGGTYVPWISASQGDLSGVNVNSSSLIIQNAGFYDVQFNSNLTLPSPSGGKIVEAALFVNGIHQQDMHGRIWTKDAGKQVDLSFSGIIELMENDVVGVYFTMDDGGIIRLELANLNLSRLN